ncbi:NAD(P)-dependent alcohol dehydrogenase [Sphingobium sp. JS3065]|uniref:NAD(P)-dependent alcohol dehydrogenase n=1 Tax=Sphingobium sp. JS3065 TaxID=2970925 RepID=UPI002264FDF9|nr:NAD(P)-dependent alcohol dehydrogenase [Sphingobium sp. JS3065]UZW57517.1 NAD(P)-dependent alcohol dehydrogenase [Sphingobium sp. JS3065]
MATEAIVALLSAIGEPLRLTNAQIADPRADELLVKIAGTGICHTDLTVQHGRFPSPVPIILGHEGSGVVVAVGDDVGDIAVDDNVVLTFMSCGVCSSCRSDDPAYCEKFGQLNMGGYREDGSSATCCNGHEVAGHFFGQSSFATYALVNRRNAVKVRPDAPIHMLGPLGCGLQTGAGTILNALKPEKGSSCVIFGGGGVGLSAVMAARLVGCDPIILCEPVESRRALGLELGATIAIDPRAEGDISARLMELCGGGVDVICDTTGIPAMIEAAVQALGIGGKLGLVGMNSMDAMATLSVVSILSKGLTIKGVIEGDSNPRIFIPYLVDLFMAGEFPLDRLISFFDISQINEAFAAQEKGAAIKPILTFAS